MPYKSKAQRAWMHKNLPEVAKRWDKAYPTASLPTRVKPKAKVKLKRNPKRK